MRRASDGADDYLIHVDNLGIQVESDGDSRQITHDIAFALRAGERIGIVGESGCGKSMTALAILGLLPVNARPVSGRIVFEDKALLGLTRSDLQRIRGRKIGMIFQEPMSALDPVFKVGEQIAETLRVHLGVSRRQARETALASLRSVGIPDPVKRYDDYPHQLSGGMRQRVMIAIATACEPSLVIADEPTTALDVTIQAQILELLVDQTSRLGAGLILISHDLGVVAHTCSDVIVMYAGEIVERGHVDDILARPLHPYTSSLLRCLPKAENRKQQLFSIPGRMPEAGSLHAGCRFSPRCGFVAKGCEAAQSEIRVGSRTVRCGRHDAIALRGALS